MSLYLFIVLPLTGNKEINSVTINQDDPKGLPMWAYILISVGVILIIAVVAYIFYNKKKKKANTKKKKSSKNSKSKNSSKSKKKVHEHK